MFQLAQNKISGYKLVDKGSGIWQMIMPNGTYTGSMVQVCKYAVLNLGFDLKELEIGVIEMEAHFHNAAEYGIFKRFMWTYDTEEKNANTTLN